MLAFAAARGHPAVDAPIAELQRQLQDNLQNADRWVRLGRAWVRKARIAADPGYYLSAEACANTALQIEPANRAAQNLLALVLLNGHRFREAAALAQKILAQDPDDVMALGSLSDALLELGDLEGAQRAVEQMLEKKPSLPSYSRAGYLHWLSGDETAAIAALRSAFDAGRGQRDPEPSVWVLGQLAAIFWHRGDLEAARAGYELALGIQPDSATALAGVARIELAQGNLQRAITLAARSFELQPVPETAWLLGDARAAAGDQAGSAAAYQQLRRLGATSDHRTLALFLATRGEDLERAVRLAAEEMAARPGPITRDTYAYALYRAGQLDRAKEVIAPNRTLGAKEPLLLYHAGAIALATGEPDRGRALLREALARNPSFDPTAARHAAQLLEGSVR